MKIPQIKNLIACVSKIFVIWFADIGPLFGVALSGCSRFEFNQAKSNAEKLLKQPAPAEKHALPTAVLRHRIWLLG